MDSQIANEIAFDILQPNQKEQNSAKAIEISRSFISDTITAPSEDMYAYAIQASIGDDVYYDDASSNALEVQMAQIAGKEAALFLPSGTMSNQVAIRSHLHQPPHSIICDARSHLNQYEAGGAALFSGATTITVLPHNRHHMTLDDIKRQLVEGDNIHTAPTHLICMENTMNGTIQPQEDIIAICEFARSRNIKTHLDGARLWHVASATSTSLQDLCAPFDTVNMCFSKGLGAPVGSMLVGPQEFIKKARWFRKQFGGGMRQTGFLSACAAYALTHNYPLLTHVHGLAKRLEEGLTEIGVRITSKAETCMVFYDPAPIGVTYRQIIDRANTLPNPVLINGSRLVVHIQTTDSAVDDLLLVIADLAKERKARGDVVDSPKKDKRYIDVYIIAGPKGNGE